jgi:hypothetical protein
VKYSVLISALIIVFATQAADLILQFPTNNPNVFEEIAISQGVVPIFYDAAKDIGKTDAKGRQTVNVGDIIESLPLTIQKEERVNVLKHFLQVYSLLPLQEQPGDYIKPSKARDTELALIKALNLNKEAYAEKLAHFITLADYVGNEEVLPPLLKLYAAKLSQNPEAAVTIFKINDMFDGNLAELLMQIIYYDHLALAIAPIPEVYSFSFDKCNSYKTALKADPNNRIKNYCQFMCQSASRDNSDRHVVFDALYLYLLMAYKDVNTSMGISAKYISQKITDSVKELIMEKNIRNGYTKEDITLMILSKPTEAFDFIDALKDTLPILDDMMQDTNTNNINGKF